MLSKEREKLIRSLHTKKGREESGLCLVESAKVIKTAGKSIEFEFTPEMTPNFNKLVTTETPQEMAAVARIPEWTIEEIKSRPTIVVLDGVQDPGNVGTILRLCLGFNASILLVESADVTNPKVVRSSVGALFQVPWIVLKRDEAKDLPLLFLEKEGKREVFRLEKTSKSKSIEAIKTKEPAIIIVGSEGSGIKLDIDGTSIAITHDPALESLNVSQALAIALFTRF
ncbi:MAG: RNA methyltransferase [Patescibacteria group bacterium]